MTDEFVVHPSGANITPEIQTPEWVKDAIFYQIFPDRFAKSDAVPKVSGLQPWGAPPTPHGYVPLCDA